MDPGLPTAAEPGTAADLGGVTGWLVSVMESIGGPGAGLAVALENVFPPIPSEVILPLAGFTASRGELTVAGAVAWTTLGSLAGAFLLYGLGAGLGRSRTRALLTALPLVTPADIDKAEGWFARHGPAAVFFGRMVPIVRSFISLPAGVERMPPVRFGLLTAAGSLLWNTVFVVAGYLLGASWPVVGAYAEVMQWVVIVLLVSAVVVFVVGRLRRRPAP